MGAEGDDYQLGHAASELERLDLQGRLLRPATLALLSAAGLRPGMRVLDLGSGAGDMAFAAAELVGDGGSVLGVERSPNAVERAEGRTRDRGLQNVHFVVGDVAEPAGGGPFDAIVGRLVLMYVPDPAAVIRTQATLLRPGGIVAPIEFEVPSGRSIPPTALVDRVIAWVNTTFERAGIAPSLGPRLWSVLSEAGLRPAGMLGAQPLFEPADPAGPALVAAIVHTILPIIEQTGTATAAEIQPATLQDRLAAELVAANAVLAHPMLFCAWATAD